MKFRNPYTKQVFQSMLEAIGQWNEEVRVISFVGGGGKTTLLYTMAEELKEKGYRVAVTTTTHMYRPEAFFYETVTKEAFQRKGIATFGTICSEGKISTLPQKEWEILLQMADYILVEADGSKGKPLKVPADHEPVIPKECNFVVGIIGYESVGKTIEAASHRPVDVAAFLQKEQKDAITIRDLIKVSTSPKGLLKGVHVPYIIIWNQFDGEIVPIREKIPLLLCERKKKEKDLQFQYVDGNIQEKDKMEV